MYVGMTIDVDDANIFGGYRCQASDGGETNRMIAIKRMRETNDILYVCVRERGVEEDNGRQ